MDDAELAQLKRKQYLGDAVYVVFDGYHVVLTTEDGERTTNSIYIEPEVLHAFELYVKGLREGIEKAGGRL